MSCCTSIVLITFPGEECVARLNEILERHGFPALKETSGSAAEFQKPMHLDVWQGAYNYFVAASDEFEAFVRNKRNWDSPDDMVCVIHHESYIGLTVISHS